MFSVIISEKGGAERRETFDRAEINVGRVQGNDLMLPKGNVSKRHARLLFRDGRFIVTDLKSTNGTYVNGRKIAQATIVREGDKIYIGDFVLRIEAGQGSAAQASPSQPAPPMEDMPSDLQSSPPGPVEEGRPSPVARPPALPAKPPPAPTSGGAPGIIPAPPPIPKQISAAVPVVDAPATLAPEAGIPRPRPIPDAPRIPEIPRPAPTGSQATPASPDLAAARASAPPGEPPSSSQPSSHAEKGIRAPAPRIEPKTGDRHEIISHFPLEHDPDESLHFAVPAPPRVPSSAKPFNRTAQSAPGAPPAPAAPTAPAGPSRAPTQPTAPGTPFHLPPPEKPAIQAGAVPPDRATAPSVGLAALGIVAGRPLEGRPKSTAPAEGLHRPPSGDYVPPLPVAPAPTFVPNPRATAQRAALAALIEGVRERVDLSPLAEGASPDDALAARIERALADAAGTLRDEGDVDTLLVEARREICELGPLTSLLPDEDVSEIQVVRHDLVVGLRGGRAVPVDLGFSSEAAVGRVVRRLCLASGKALAEGETFVERRLAGGHAGARLFAVLPRSNDLGHVVVIRKPRRADLSLEDLVRSGTISRAMASLLSQCAHARANVLVTGAAGAGTTTLLGALAGAGSTEDRVLVLQEEDELVLNQPHTVSLLLGDRPEERVRAVQAAARIRPDRLVVGAFCGAAAAEMVDAMGSGANGVLAGARAPTLRQAVVRLAADVAAARPGLSPDVAREWLASAFDLAIEVARLRDGRHRVLRIAEPILDAGRIGLRDIFTFSVERTAAGGTLEGTFAATGVIPAILDDLAARGFPVDPSIFRRHSRPDGSDGGTVQSPRLATSDRSSSPGPDASPLPRVR